MLNFCTFLFLSSVIFALANCKRATVVTLLLALFMYILIGNGFLASALTQSLQYNYFQLTNIQWQAKNVIVLLGEGAEKLPNTTNRVEPLGVAYSRIFEAGALYYACRRSHHQCLIIVSGGDALKAGRSEAEVYQTKLEALGVSAQDILQEANSNNTYQNAEFTHRILQAQHVSQVILVTSAWHMQRAALFFKHFGVPVIPAASDFFIVKPVWIPSSSYFSLTDLMLHEYIGMLEFHLYNFLGWNK